MAWVCVVGDSEMYPSDDLFLTFCKSLRINSNHSASGNRFQAVVRVSDAPEPFLHAVAEKIEINEIQVNIMKSIMNALG